MRANTKAMLAATAAMFGASGIGLALKAPKRIKRYPQMVTSSSEEIALHNKSVTSRQVIRRNTRPWKQGATA